MIITQIVTGLAIFLWLAFQHVVALAEPVRIVAFGDSLTAGYQLAPDASFPARLVQQLKARGHDIEVTNAGVSGDTSTGALSRFHWAVPAGTDIVIVELGANDALRGIDPNQTRSSIDQILTKLRKLGADVLLTGVKAPPNLGADYAAKFDPIYSELASKHKVLLYPFFLKGVAAKPALNLADGMHPNKKGVDVIVANILPLVEKLISRRIDE